MVKALMAFGWLRDLVIVLLLLAGNHVRHTSFTIGITIMLGGLVVFAERFLWSWHLGDLKDSQEQASN